MLSEGYFAHYTKYLSSLPNSLVKQVKRGRRVRICSGMQQVVRAQPCTIGMEAGQIHPRQPRIVTIWTDMGHLPSTRFWSYSDVERAPHV